MTQTPFVEGDMTNAELRAALLNLTQLMTTQDQAMTVQANREIRPRVQQNASTMASL